MLYRKSRGKDNTISQKNQTIIEPLRVVDLPFGRSKTLEGLRKNERAMTVEL